MGVVDVHDEAPLSHRVTALEKILLPNGRPGLEERLRDYIDARDKHKEANCEESVQVLADVLKCETQERKEQHKDNEQRFSSIERLVYIGVGILIALHALDWVIMPKLIK